MSVRLHFDFSYYPVSFEKIVSYTKNTTRLFFQTILPIETKQNSLKKRVLSWKKEIPTFQKKEDQELLLSLFSSWKTLPFSIQKPIKDLFSTVEIETIQELLKEVFLRAEENHLRLDERFFSEAFSKEKLEKEILKKDQAYSLTKKMVTLAEKTKLIAKDDPISPGAIKEFFLSILKRVVSLLNIIISCMDITESSQSAVTIWEKSYSLDIILKLFMVPIALVHFFTPKGTSLFESILVTGGVILGALGFLYIYNKFLRPVTWDIPYCKNLDDFSSKSTKYFTGHEEQVEKIFSFCENGSEEKKPFLLVGSIGVGKTTGAKRAARRLKKSKMLFIDTPKFINGNSYSSFGDKIDRIKKQIPEKHKNACILFFDQFGAVIEKEGESFGNSLNIVMGELRCGGAITDEEFKKLKEKHPSLVDRFEIIHFEELDEKKHIEKILIGSWQKKEKKIPIKNQETFFSFVKEKIKKKDGGWDLREAHDLLDKLFDQYVEEWKAPPFSETIRSLQKERERNILFDQDIKEEPILIDENKKTYECLSYYHNLWQYFEKMKVKLALKKDRKTITKKEETYFLVMDKFILPCLEKILNEKRSQMSSPPPFSFEDLIQKRKTS